MDRQETTKLEDVAEEVVDGMVTEIAELKNMVAEKDKIINVIGQRMTFLENLVTSVVTGAHNYKALSEALDPTK